MTKASQGKNNRGSASQDAPGKVYVAQTGFRLRPLARLMRQGFALTALCTQLPGVALAAPPAPGVRVPLTALPSGPVSPNVAGTIGARAIYSPNVVSGTFNPYTVANNADGSVTARIHQSSNAGILQWERFDIGANATVNIDQPSTSSILLNKVNDGDYNHSVVIEGQLNANGQVYIYNPNGIIFGKTSRVNVNSLVATTLKIDDNRFLAGILSPNLLPIFAADAAGTPGVILVEGEKDTNGSRQQAWITADKGGRILLAGPSVTNNGVLSAPDGQVVLAAGGKLFISSPTDVKMRGLVVEVANDNLAPEARGAVTNDELGEIRVGRGNATLVGLAVNQMGLVSATTSVSENGSIYLHARDGAKKLTAADVVTTSNGGALVLGTDSVTQILPDLMDETTSSGTTFNNSLVDLSGKTIHFQENSKIFAPSGDVTASAFAKAGLGAEYSPNGNGHLYFDTGAVIDVAGTTGTQLAMESNVIQVQLRGSELADSPLQRRAPVKSQTVSIDIRRGTPLATIQGWLDLVEHGIGERTATGGKITLSADTDIVVNQGAKLNVSGGLVTYKPGYIATSRLSSDGIVYDIGDASAQRIYDSVIAPVTGPRNFQPGYVQGYNAGSIAFNAPAMTVQGDLEGSVTTGSQQRNIGANGVPLGGLLLIGNAETKDDLTRLHFGGSVHLEGNTASGIGIPSFDDSNPSGPLHLPDALKTDADFSAAAMAAKGFSRFRVYADEGKASVDKDLALAPGGELTISARDGITISADITAPGGKVSAISPTSVAVADGVSIDVAGRWTNDRGNTGPALDAQGDPVTPIVLKGGSISLVASSGGVLGQVDIGNNVSLDVSGGAWLNGAGKMTTGNGGSIAIGPSVSGTNLTDFHGLSLGNGLVTKGYGVTNGGTIQISAPNVLLGVNSSEPQTLGLAASWFQQGGFANFDVRAGGNLTVATDATITTRTDNWISTSSTTSTSSGRMSDAFDIATLPTGSAIGSRKAASLNLRAAREYESGQGILDVKEGAMLATDPGGSITLAAGTLLSVNGTVTAPGGTINLFLTPDSGVPTLPERSIWLGSSATLDASSGAASLSQDQRSRVQASLGRNWPTSLWLNSLGLTQGNLLDGGQIKIGRFGTKQLDAALGFVLVNSGANLNVSGATATMTITAKRGGIQTRVIASNGGAISIRAEEGLLLDGSLAGSAGNDSARGGSLSLTMDREDNSTAAFQNANLVVASSEPNPGTPGNGVIPAGLAPGLAISGLTGQGFVAASTINNGGFDYVQLKSAGAIDFDLSGGIMALAARSTLSVDAPTIGSRNGSANSSVNLNAPYVAVGNTDWRYQSDSHAASTGNASLLVNAGTADLIGHSALNYFGNVHFIVTGDIRLVGQVAADLTTEATSSLSPIHAFGNFTVAGNMRFSSAQVYPGSLSEFTLAATGADSSISFTSNGHAAGIPLSAAGSLKVQAPDITQNGIVRAPLGTIDFEAENTLNYGPGSLTSVAGAPIVPLGFVQNGRDWLYDFGSGHTINLSDSTASNYVALPDKSIISRGAMVNLQNVSGKTATLDLSGGGELQAYEFTPGPGGSKDILALANTYAILPGYTSSVAPADFQNGTPELKAGDKVYLSDIAGLKSGFYTLLPAHYALLPGAYAINPVAGSKNMVASQNFKTLLGIWQVAGYRSSLGGGADNLWQGFSLTPSAVVRQQSEFTNYTANAFMDSTGVTLAKDGGHVVFDVGQSLAIKGLVRLEAAPGGQRGIADISAPSITVVSDTSQLLPTEADADTLIFTAADLHALGADSLLLGGVRTQNSRGQTITVGAGQVIVANDQQHALSGSEILLVAGSREMLAPVTGTVTVDSGSAGQGLVLVKEGSSIAAEGTLTHNPQMISLVNKVNPDSLGADGALLRVSNGSAVDINRNLVTPDGTLTTPARAAGTVTLEAGAKVSANGSIMIDATKTTTVSATPILGANAALQLGADRISLGSTSPLNVAGLRIDDFGLDSLGYLTALTLTSYSSFDVYGSVMLGNATMQHLSIKTGNVRAFGNASDASVFKAAESISLLGKSVDSVPPQQSGAGGTLTFNSKNIELGDLNFAVRGFSHTTLNAANDIVVTGHGSALSADRDLTLMAGRITILNGADASITAGRSLILSKSSGVAGALPAPGYGGKLQFVGKTIASDADIVALAGQISMNSNATPNDIANGLEVAGGTVKVSGGTISTAGTAVAFGSTVAYAPAGNIAIDGGAGNVVIDSTATVDVSSTGAAAGTLSLKAVNGSNGKAMVNGTLKGQATEGVDGLLPTQGRFTLDTDKLDTDSLGNPIFGALNTKLDAAGFTESRNFRLHNDDVTLGNGETISAHQVVIAADKGDLTIAGSISADGRKGGSIELYAAEAAAGGHKGNITIASSAMLSASANVAANSPAGSTGDGGHIVIGTATADGSQPGIPGGDASISINAGATLDVSGDGASGQGGTVQLRAPRLSGNNDVAIATLDGSSIKGSRSTSIEAYKVYSASNIKSDDDVAGIILKVADQTGAPAGAMYNEALDFVANQANTFSRFSNIASVALLPGLEVRSSGDLTVSVNETDATAKQDRGWNLNAWRFLDQTGNLTQPGVLTLRATNNLTINGSISDGFKKSTNTSMPDWVLDSSDGGLSSWSYRLSGGNDLAAANPLATIPKTITGDVKLSFARPSDATGTDSPVAVVRTGTGSIDIAAGRDVLLDTLDLTTNHLLVQNYSGVNFASDKLLGATIYTAGRAADVSPAVAPLDKDNSVYGGTASTGARFTQDGGSISIYADRDFAGPVTQQLINNWLFRQGRATTDSAGNSIFAKAQIGRGSGPTQFTAWWSRFDYFNEGIATFGGGDITVRANTGNVIDLSASVASSGFYTPINGVFTADAVLTENGGGDLSVSAGGDIRGGVFYVQKGSASLTALGSISEGNRKIVNTIGGITTPVALGPLLAQGDSQFTLTAGKDLQIEAVFNPTLFTQSAKNVPNVLAGKSDLFTSFTDQLSYFSTYSADSAVKLSSISGNIFLNENSAALVGAGGTDLSWNQGLNLPRLSLIHPGRLIAAALNGDIGFRDGFSLWPSQKGTLELLAKGSITADTAVNSSGVTLAMSQPIVMIDRDPATLLPATAPYIPDVTDFNTVQSTINATGITYHSADGLHKDDSTPVRIVALDGDISFKVNNSHPASLVLPKKAEIVAGRDIVDTGFSIQHLNTSDVTTVTAGRDIVDSTVADGINYASHTVAGPGRIDFNAGRNFDLGNSKGGVVTRGNLDNPYLPQEGSAINIVAGAVPDYAGFAKQFSGAADLNAAEQMSLIEFTQKLVPMLPANASAEEAWLAFNNLPLDARHPFYDTLFFGALQLSSGAVGSGPLDLTKFDATIASLFPEASSQGGNVNVFGSQLKTSRGGVINIYAPGGSVYAGLVSIPEYVKSKDASELGIFTIGGGAIQALVKTDFLVNQGRVFTLGGGDITLASQYGNIDAGKGAKTAQAAPPPVLTTDKDGNTQVDISGSISGSGIATLRTAEEVPASSVYPIAPRGIFDAGDAGVRSTGSVNIVAQTVLNASNIAAAGSVSGAKSADTSGMASAAAAPSSQPVTNSDSFANGLAKDPNAASTLTVELIGYGDGYHANNDKGQQDVTQPHQTLPGDETDDERKKKKKLL